MIYLTFNLSWIVFNLILAFIPVLFTIALEKKLNRFVRFALLFFWFIFLPNTIYLVTDIQYLPIQFLMADLPEKVALLIQYGVVIFLGIFIFGLFWEIKSKALEWD